MILFKLIVLYFEVSFLAGLFVWPSFALTSDPPGTGRLPKSMGALGLMLRQRYADSLNTPIPDRLAKLLEKLEAAPSRPAP